MKTKRMVKNMDKPPIHLGNIRKLIEDFEKAKEMEVASRRVAHALGAEVGLKPEEVDQALRMANADVKGELDFKETLQGLYVGGTGQNPAAEPGDVAAKKGRPYIEKILDDRNY